MGSCSSKKTSILLNNNNNNDYDYDSDSDSEYANTHPNELSE